jgi:hypothetical protein
MPRIMRDSTNAADIPSDGTQLVAGYANGAYAWSQVDFDRFPAAGHVLIDVNGSRPDADVLDVENGDASVPTAVQWIRTKYRQAHDFPPVIYCDRSTLPSLIEACAESQFQPGVHYYLWVATLDGTQQLENVIGVAAVQYAGQDATGGHYDESIVYADLWKRVSWSTGPAWPGYDFEYFEGQEPAYVEAVKTWQAQMAARGWTIAVDGFYGPQSAEVARAFQQDSTAHGWPLAGDGIVGRETWRASWERPVS